MEHPTIRGLYVYENAISPSDQVRLLEEIDNNEWNTVISRRTQHYGRFYDYSSKSASTQAPPMPPLIQFVANALLAYGLFDRVPEEALVNEYYQKTGIAAHTDKNVFGPVVAGVNLGDEAVMIFSHASLAPSGVPVLLKPGSVFFLSGPARHEWKHEIKGTIGYVADGVKKKKSSNYRRVSITYRTMNS